MKQERSYLPIMADDLMSKLNPSNLPVLPVAAHRLSGLPATPFKFSICTLVTRAGEYTEMLESFVRAGFAPEDCEYLFISNIEGNERDAYEGYNLFLQTARGEYIILCHQDILLNFDRREVLEKRIRELNELDPTWALLGNAGIGRRFGQPVVSIRISYPDGDGTIGVFPIKAQSLDENFIVVRREANLCVSHNLAGYHFYGTDMCRIAKVLGRTAYVVDFHLLHKSRGKFDDQFFRDREQFVKKYQKALRGGRVYTTTGPIYLSGNTLASWLFTPGPRAALFQRVHALRRPPRHQWSAERTEEIRQLQAELGTGWHVFYWIRHKIISRITKAMRWLDKKVFNRQASAPK